LGGCGVFDPFFGGGSEHVLGSFVARLLPFPDALLGAIGYGAEAVTDILGGEDRWHVRPILVLLFGAEAAAMALAGIALLLIQALVVRQGCTLCIASALVSVLIFALVLPEMLASIRFLKGIRDRHVLGI
jgi:uncharacterized membrane protein